MILNHAKVFGAFVLVLGTGAAVLAYQTTKGSGSPPPAGATEVARPSAEPAPAPTATAMTDWPALITPVDANPKNRPIVEKLDLRLSMNFPNATPLEDVLKYIKQCTQDETVGLPNGIPIYVDPQGLQDSAVTMASTVTMDLEGVPLKTSLELALKQLSLAFKVKDGLMMIITTNGAETPIEILLDKSERGELTREQYNQLIELLKLRSQVNQLAHPQGKGIH